ncbi:MAG: HAD-IA family hydrolase [Bacteroidales bacterium]|nr:HAD-IA family hydrolase [Bacteroidales bacterium]
MGKEKTKIKAVLFDMDGVLLDSERFITLAGMEMFREKGFTVKFEDFKEFTGMGENRFLGGVAEKYGIPFEVEKDKSRAYEIYANIVKGELEPLPGVNEFIAKCREKGLKIAVATSADRIKMQINLSEIGLSEQVFDVTVNGMEVTHKKPDPEIFITAAGKLGVEPAFCLVVEDAVSGLRAAKSAGCKCLTLTTSFKASDFKGSDWIACDLSEAPDACLNW